MTEKYGISVDDETHGSIEEYRQRRDSESGALTIVNRSQAARELLNIGLVAAEVIENSDDIALDHGKPREAFVRQAVLNELRRESDDE